MTDRQRFESKFDRGPGCWLWTAVTARGYGRFRYGGRLAGAHRVAYELYVGQIPDGLQVLHHCDVRACVNPEHLYAGTHADNMADRNRRGRTQHHGKGITIGEDHPRAKLTDAVVLTARRARANGAGVRELARLYGVHRSTMAAALYGRNWKHLPIDRQ